MIMKKNMFLILKRITYKEKKLPAESAGSFKHIKPIQINQINPIKLFQLISMVLPKSETKIEF